MTTKPPASVSGEATQPLTLEGAKKNFNDAWTALCNIPATDATQIALIALRAVLPKTASMVHNYRYREVSAMAQFSARLMDNRKNIHGADGHVRTDVEIKTCGLRSRNVTPNAGIGVFDKIHTRVSRARTVATVVLKAALDGHDAHSGPFSFDGETWHSLLGVAKIRRALFEAERDGLDQVRLPNILKPNRLTSNPSVKDINFCLFLEGGVDPLLTVETTIDEIECHLAEPFEGAAEIYQAKQANRSNEKAPSARDSVSISLRHLMSMGKAARLVHLDTDVLREQDMWLTDDVLNWARRAGSDKVKKQLEELVNHRAAQMGTPADPPKGRGPKR